MNPFGKRPTGVLTLVQTDNALHDALGLICVPTIVSGLATMFVGANFKLSLGSKVFWPNYDAKQDDGNNVYLGTFVQRINNTQIRINVENIGENIRSSKKKK